MNMFTKLIAELHIIVGLVGFGRTLVPEIEIVRTIQYFNRAVMIF